MVEVAEQRLVEEFVPHSPVEGLAEAVLHRTTRRDVVPLDADLLRPEQDGVRGELRSVVADDELRLAVPGDERRQFAGHPPARDRSIWDRGEALFFHVVDDVEHAEPLPGRHLIVNEVERPTGIGARFDDHRRTGSDGPLAAAAPANRQTFLAVEPLGPLVVHDVSLLPQQNVQAPIAEPPPLGRQFPQTTTQQGVVVPPGAGADGRSVGTGDGTRPPLADVVLAQDVGDGFPNGGGRHHFFASRSFRTEASRMASANRRFSLAFSSSSAFRRFASETSMPPNFAFQA